MGLQETLKSDFIDAAYRTAANQISEIVKQGIIKTLSSQQKKGSKNAQVKNIQELLDSELGKSFIAYILGVALDQLPMFKDDPRAKRLAREFRVHGMASAGNFVADKMLAQLMPALSGAMKNLPMVKEKEEEEAAAKADSILSKVDLPSQQR